VFARVAVIGAGSWGTTIASIACRKVDTTLWARRKDLADEIEETHANPSYTGDLSLAGVTATASLQEAVGGADLVVMAVPSHGFRAVLEQAEPWISQGAPIMSVTKGMEQGSLKRMTEVIAEVAPGRPVAVLTGPNLVREILAGKPACSVVAMADSSTAAALQQLFTTESFRVYTNADVVGCEVAGAIKNVTAIASGMSDGLELGDNARAALITRGLAELSRLGAALGGRPATFWGLTGLGDLMATCVSSHSRNRYVEIGRASCRERV
jgi:glycerol-3-phosphate dehydrogenase (NAD(P)+)